MVGHAFHSKEFRSVILWLAVFLTYELIPIFWPGCPWTTFTGTIRGAIRWWHAVAFLLILWMVVLFGHFDDGWRARYLILLAFATFAGVLIHAVTP